MTWLFSFNGLCSRIDLCYARKHNLHIGLSTWMHVCMINRHHLLCNRGWHLGFFERRGGYSQLLDWKSGTNCSSSGAWAVRQKKRGWLKSSKMLRGKKKLFMQSFLALFLVFVDSILAMLALFLLFSYLLQSIFPGAGSDPEIALKDTHGSYL